MNRYNEKIRGLLRDNRGAWVDLFYIVRKELHSIFTDPGVLIIFVVATIIYPLVCNFIYNRENVNDIPVAVVDMNHSTQSRQYIRMLDATPEVKITTHCMNMAEAKRMQQTGQIHGIVYIPKDFSHNIASNMQTTVSYYCDATSFMYYRDLTSAVSYVSKTMGYQIEARGLIAKGSTYDDAMRSLRPFVPTVQTLFNPGGYPSFIIPIIIILVIQQTIFMGIGMMAGKTTEKSKWRDLTPNNIHYRGLFRIIFGRAIAVFLVYVPIVIYELIIIPHIFNIPQLMTTPAELLWFILPFLLSSIFLGMTISTMFYHRENAIPVFVFMSVPLLLMSGFSWPRESMPDFWRWVSYLFPSTYAINGTVRMNTLGANLIQISWEHFMLWALTFVYLGTAYFAYMMRLTKKERWRRLHERIFNARRQRQKESTTSHPSTD